MWFLLNRSSAQFKRQTLNNSTELVRFQFEMKTERVTTSCRWWLFWKFTFRPCCSDHHNAWISSTMISEMSIALVVAVASYIAHNEMRTNGTLLSADFVRRLFEWLAKRLTGKRLFGKEKQKEIVVWPAVELPMIRIAKEEGIDSAAAPNGK